MIQSLYTGRAGITTLQSRVDIIGANIANTNTTGYKSTRMDFKDMLYSEMQRIVQPQDDYNMQLGHGVLPGNTLRDFKQGALFTTGNNLDITIEGDGFFALENAQGEVEYTRNGVMHGSMEEDGVYLVNSDGKYFLDTDGQRIQLPGSVSDLVVEPEGTLKNGSDPDAFGQMAVYKFPNREGLEAVGGNAFVSSQASGDAALSDDTKIMQGYTEGSNVDIALEMTRLIRTQRAFQLAARCVTNADRMEEVANALRT